jgi:hypothetical protein
LACRQRCVASECEYHNECPPHLGSNVDTHVSRDAWVDFQRFLHSVTEDSFAPKYVYDIPAHYKRFRARHRAKYASAAQCSTLHDLAPIIAEYL